MSTGLLLGRWYAPLAKGASSFSASPAGSPALQCVSTAPPKPCAIAEMVLTETLPKPKGGTRVLHCVAKTVVAAGKAGRYTAEKRGAWVGGTDTAVFELLANPKATGASPTPLAVSVTSVHGPCGAAGHHRIDVTSIADAAEEAKALPATLQTDMQLHCTARWFDTRGVSALVLNDLVSPFWFPASSIKSFRIAAAACGNNPPIPAKAGLAAITARVNVYPADTCTLEFTTPSLAKFEKSYERSFSKGEGTKTGKWTTKDERSGSTSWRFGSDVGGSAWGWSADGKKKPVHTETERLDSSTTVERSRSGNSKARTETTTTVEGDSATTSTQAYSNKGNPKGKPATRTGPATQDQATAAREGTLQDWKLELKRNGAIPAGFDARKVLDAWKFRRETLAKLQELFNAPKLTIGWKPSLAVDGLAGKLKLEWGYREGGAKAAEGGHNLVTRYLKGDLDIVLLDATGGVFVGLKFDAPAMMNVWGVPDAELGGEIKANGSAKVALPGFEWDLDDATGGVGQVKPTGKFTVTGALKAVIQDSRWLNLVAQVSGGIKVEGAFTLGDQAPFLAVSFASEDVEGKVEVGALGRVKEFAPVTLAKGEEFWSWDSRAGTAPATGKQGKP